MSERPCCPSCGYTIPADAPAGELCPRCLLRQVLRSLEEDTGGRERDTSDAKD